MSYIPKFRHLFKILLRIRDINAAEGLYFEGTWHHDQGDESSALMAFSHARLLDPGFAGAHYNYAALTEKSKGRSRETLKAWQQYLQVAERDHRQARDLIEKVKDHVVELEKAMS